MEGEEPLSGCALCYIALLVVVIVVDCTSSFLCAIL